MPDWLSLCVLISLLSLLTVAALLLYSGLLCDIIVQTGCPPIKKITFAYKFKEGPYKDCGQLFRESSSIGPGLATIGVFYDDPKKVPGTLCRCAVGSILSEGENKADEELLKRYETSGFNVFSFPEVTHMVTTSFPHRTFLSALLGIMRVYPRLDHYIKERRLCAHPFLEIYRDSQIQFMAPLARQGDFYVPEVRPVERRSSEQEDSHSDSDISGADSNSEYSSGSGVLLSDSRETSLAASSVRSVPVQDKGNRSCGGGSSRGSSFKEPDCEQTGERREGGDEQLRGHSDQKSPEAPAQEWWGVVGGEE
ncbi:testis-expressed sequence 264 protein [Stegastes partitus]|uniref:Testis-expressed sequence 264 protein n=1 Tax=Stegastes partitus TaxID=144197 RepID=A0A9Y4K819_9TELE|nr:PREDICTED: testis-expressed sequence 264 protein [Stegastes partitus]